MLLFNQMSKLTSFSFLKNIQFKQFKKDFEKWSNVFRFQAFFGMFYHF